MYANKLFIPLLNSFNFCNYLFISYNFCKAIHVELFMTFVFSLFIRLYISVHSLNGISDMWLIKNLQECAQLTFITSFLFVHTHMFLCLFIKLILLSLIKINVKEFIQFLTSPKDLQKFRASTKRNCCK